MICEPCPSTLLLLQHKKCFSATMGMNGSPSLPFGTFVLQLKFPINSHLSSFSIVPLLFNLILNITPESKSKVSNSISPW